MGKASKVILILATIAVAACTACMQTHLIADGTQGHKVAESFIQFMALLGLLKTKPLFGDSGGSGGGGAGVGALLPLLFLVALCSGCEGIPATPGGLAFDFILTGGIVAFVVVRGLARLERSALLVALFVLPLTAGCPTAKKVAYDAAACAVGQVPSVVVDTVGEATRSLTGDPGAPSWSDFAKGDLLKYGIDAAICIVQAAIHDIDGAMAGTKGQVAPQYIAGHQRGVEWLAQHGVKHDHSATMHAMGDIRLRVMQLATITEPVPACDNRADYDTQWCRPMLDHNLPTLDR